MICLLPTPPQRVRLPLMLISLGLFSRLNHDTEMTSTTPSPTHQRWTNTYPQPPSLLRAISLARTAPSTTAALPPTTKPLPSRSSKRSSSSTRKTTTTTTTTNGALCPSSPCRPGVPLRRHHHHLPRSLLPRLLHRRRQQHQHSWSSLLLSCRRRRGLCFVGWRPSRAFPAAGFRSLVLAAAQSRPGDAAAALMGLEKQLEHEEEGSWGGRCW